MTIAPEKDNRNIPVADAIPSAAANQTEDAVVKPRDCFEFLLMAPAPKKPTEDDIAAAIRVGSAEGNAAKLVDMRIAEPRDTKLNVLMPARELAARLSTPIMPPTTSATRRRQRIRASTIRDGGVDSVLPRRFSRWC